MAVTLLSWNINNFSQKKGCNEIYEYVKEVYELCDAQFLAVVEITSFMGDSFGDEIGGRINYGNTIRYQDSDQYVGHSEQYLAFWNTNFFNHTNTIDNFSYVEFPQSSQRPPCIYMMDVAVASNKVYKNAPMCLFHAPGPQNGASYVATGCDNISKVKEIASAKQGVIMGDFNISPSASNQSYGSNAFGNIIKLGYNMQLISIATSLKTVKGVGSPNSLNDCLSSQYDNFFVNMPGATVKGTLVDLITPAVNVKGNNSYNATYAKALGAWQAKKLGYSSGYVCTYNTIYDAFVAYRSCVSDHLPIKLVLS